MITSKLKKQLLEMKDPDYPLLKKLRLKAPGTYIHSLMVSELAVYAVLRYEKKTSALLTQVGALYHDIGKIIKPEVYAENQEDNTYPFHPEIIITHVKKSMELAYAFSFPEEIIRFICTHHGTQNSPQEEDKTQNKYPESFLPQTIEETLVMLADSTEAAVRSTQSFNNKKILKEVVHKVFMQKIENNQLRNSVLTTYDMDLIEKDFLEMIFAIYHRRHATE
jgi:hypothetical protein